MAHHAGFSQSCAKGSNLVSIAGSDATASLTDGGGGADFMRRLR